MKYATECETETGEADPSDSYAVALERALRERNALVEQVTQLQAECTRLEEARRALERKQ
jgi:hypothetical protein